MWSTFEILVTVIIILTFVIVLWKFGLPWYRARSRKVAVGEEDEAYDRLADQKSDEEGRVDLTGAFYYQQQKL